MSRGVVSRFLETSEAASFRDSSKWETEPGTEPAAPLVEACQEEVWVEHVHRRWRYPAHNNSLEFEAVLLAAKCVAPGCTLPRRRFKCSCGGVAKSQ